MAGGAGSCHARHQFRARVGPIRGEPGWSRLRPPRNRPHPGQSWPELAKSCRLETKGDFAQSYPHDGGRGISTLDCVCVCVFDRFRQCACVCPAPPCCFVRAILSPVRAGIGARPSHDSALRRRSPVGEHIAPLRRGDPTSGRFDLTWVASSPRSFESSPSWIEHSPSLSNNPAGRSKRIFGRLLESSPSAVECISNLAVDLSPYLVRWRR